jgi:predicted Zn-dependent protease
MRSLNCIAGPARVVVIGVVLAVTSCTTDYVTGKKTFSLVSETQEVTMGKEADPQIVAEYGLYDDAELSQYVDRIGQALAAKSQRSDLAYTFRVLDSPVVNAFALPGGYVYVTRGILAHFNSEDQLAGVLGHEIGHVVARHSAEQMSRQQLAGLGLGVGAVFSETFRKYAEIAGFGLQLMLLKYSRAQESESDMLGVEYSTKLGYDANEMAAFFGTLKRLGEESGQSLPSFLSTHPDPGDRENRVHQLSTEWQQKVAYQSLGKSPHEYLQRIDGIVYGEDPRQGYFEGGVFYHPSLRFQFPVPKDWHVVNSAATVLMVSSDKQAVIQLRLAEGDSPEKAADSFITKNALSVRDRQAATVHGFPAVIVSSTGQSENQQIGVQSYFIKKDASIYAFHGYSEASVVANYTSAFSTTMGGFEEVRDPKVLGKKPQRIHLKKAPKAGTLSSVLEALGMKSAMMKEGAILNGTELTDPVEQGQWVKVVGE